MGNIYFKIPIAIQHFVSRTLFLPFALQGGLKAIFDWTRCKTASTIDHVGFIGQE